MIILFTFLLTFLSPAQTLISCHDGDTCRFTHLNKTIKVRFSGIDAPEADQPFGRESRDFLTKLLKEKPIRLDCSGKSYDRQTCFVFIDQLDVQKELVKNGFAVDFPKFSRGKYKADEEFARKNKLGMWSKDLESSPHCWRHPKSRPCKKNPHYQPR